MFEEDVIKGFKAIFPCEKAEIDHRLLGGMSNYTYVVKADDAYYTYRIPGDYAECFVDRNLELANIKLIEKLNITNETIYLNLETGEKIAKFINGKSLHQLESFPYELVAKLLKKIHNSNLQAVNDYDPFTRLKVYEEHIINLGFVHGEEYLQTKANFLKYQGYLESQPKVLCHGDSQPSNFILDGTNLYAVDFEFCGNNDLMYDIACFANIKLEHGLNLLNVYFENVTQELLNRFYLWRAFQALQWYNVAVFKDLQGMSAKLKIDFKMVSEKYLDLAKSLIGKIENIY